MYSQYISGEVLHIAPGFFYDTLVTYYLPAGRSMNYFTNEVAVGPVWKAETHDFMNLLLMARPNSVIATGKNEDRPDYDTAMRSRCGPTHWRRGKTYV